MLAAAIYSAIARLALHSAEPPASFESRGQKIRRPCAFTWKKGSVSEILRYRQPAGEDARRSIADIPLAELASVVLGHPDLLDEPDPPRDIARLLGVERLAAVSRARLDEAIARARQHAAISRPSG